MRLFRTCLFWTHLAVGLSAGLVILLMSVTGVLLTYERQMIAWSDSGLRSTPPSEGAAPLPMSDVLRRVGQAEPALADPTAVSVTVRAEPDAPVMLTAGRRVFYADAYSGRLLGTGATGMRTFMSEMRGWHRWLAVERPQGSLARAVTGWSNVVFLLLIVSGAYLWMPKRWTWSHVRAVALFNVRASGKARDFNWHNVIGLWSLVPLFIVVLSAVPISFSWGNALVYRAVGETPPAGRGRGGPERAPEKGARPIPLETLDARLTAAEGYLSGWKTIAFRLPASAGAPLAFSIDRGTGGQPQLRSTLTLEAATGRVITHDTFGDATLGRRLRSIMRFAHTGEVLGIPGQTVAGLVTAGAVVLVWTGVALAWRRFRSWLGRRSNRSAVTAAPPARSTAA